jgi:hypothetical protein
MQRAMERYLDQVMCIADIRDNSKESHVREELLDHLEEKAESLKQEGYNDAEAMIKAIEDHGNPILIGYKLRSWRLIDVRLRGTARGVIAIGPKAHGVIAIGGIAVGFIAFGGIAFGVFSFGGLALALLLAWGGLAGGAFAYGGLAIGLIAFGGVAVGVIAAGGTAAGLWVPGAGSTLWSYYTWETVPNWWRSIGELLSFNPNSPTEKEAFTRLIGFLSVTTVVVITIGILIQSLLLYKERKRIKTINPSIVE